MWKEWEDYYKTLQVHFLAEPEVIRSAYLRLSKKYHPDVNASSEAEGSMSLLNRAYEVLSNPVTRQQYFMKWVEKYQQVTTPKHETFNVHPLDFSVEPIRKVLIDYFDSLANKQYEKAYNLLSERDKDKISKEDYFKWQSLVAEVFCLMSFNISFHELYHQVMLQDHKYELCVEFLVEVVEKNHIMGRLENDEFIKSMVFEKNTWQIYLGYKDLNRVIDRFQSLASLKNDRGRYSKDTFLSQVSSEQARLNRYGNCFTLLAGKMSPLKGNCVDKSKALYILQRMEATLRCLDKLCLLDEKLIMILLPETNAQSAMGVIDKMSAIFSIEKEVSIQFSIVEQDETFLDTLLNA
ncbi:MAG: DnaJ domain-containing protein [Vallitaleaceae bacterium]|nr:DnaJ domain-containing protein [Vallitaleaceae bacterium]